MSTKSVNQAVALVVLFASCALSATAAPETATVCDLSRFGADHEGLAFRTRGIYITDFRHGSGLYDPKNEACFIELGVKQSDVDGSVKRFNQAVVDGVMQFGPGTRQLVDAEVVFHWVSSPTGPPRYGSRSLIGVLEFRRILHSETKVRSSE